MDDTYMIRVVDNCWIIPAHTPLLFATWIMKGFGDDALNAVLDDDLTNYFKAAMVFGEKDDIETLKTKLNIAIDKQQKG